MNKLQLIKTSALKTSILALALLSGSVIAATDGTLGTTSTGTVNINVDIDPLVQVSNLLDFNLGTFTGGADIVATNSFCVYSNGGTYGITLSGNAGAFSLVSGANTLPYSIDFTNTGVPIPMTHAALVSAQGNANNTSTDCDAGATNNVSMTITVASSDMAAQPSGTYSGVLTVVVSAE